LSAADQSLSTGKQAFVNFTYLFQGTVDFSRSCFPDLRWNLFTVSLKRAEQKFEEAQKMGICASACSDPAEKKNNKKKTAQKYNRNKIFKIN